MGTRAVLVPESTIIEGNPLLLPAVAQGMQRDSWRMVERDPRLGLAAGFVYEEQDRKFRSRSTNRTDSVPHGAQLVRRECYEAIGGYSSDVRWPVDIDFWMRWFAAGARVGRTDRVLYDWRQHACQATRTSSLHHLDTLRACKAWYFVRGPGRGKAIDVLSVGRTLAGWREALRSAGADDVRPVEWRAVPLGQPVAADRR